MPEAAKPRLSALDALRGWAILSVVAIHSGLLIAPESAWLQLPINQAGRGVELFYVVSAFSLMYSFASSSRPVSLREYALRRVLRIGPMWWAALALYVLVYTSTPDWHVALLSVLFMHGFHPSTLYAVTGGWSIAVEAMFYCVLPPIFFFVTSTARAVALLVASLVVSHFAMGWIFEALQISDPNRAVAFAYQLSFVAQFPVFCVGILIFHAWNEAGRPQGSWGLALLASGVAVVVMASQIDNVFIFHNVANYGLGLGLITFGLVVSPIAILDNFITRHIGKVSYSIYLLHFAIMTGLQGAANGLGIPRSPSNIGYIAGLFILFALSTGAATLTYHWIEKPFIRLGRERRARFPKAQRYFWLPESWGQPSRREVLVSSSRPLS